MTFFSALTSASTATWSAPLSAAAAAALCWLNNFCATDVWSPPSPSPSTSGPVETPLGAAPMKPSASAWVAFALPCRPRIALSCAAADMALAAASCLSASSSRCSRTKPCRPGAARGSGTAFGKLGGTKSLPSGPSAASAGALPANDHVKCTSSGCCLMSSRVEATKMPLSKRSDPVPTWTERPGNILVTVLSPGNSASSTTPRRNALPWLRSSTSMAIAPKGTPAYAFDKGTSYNSFARPNAYSSTHGGLF
mmetsp:Transcript_100717/g.307889  ORF Transcript_100717/g.307889 Transcript_100717/m.307889 type:complete len:252 (-) Transcript_100717:1522-2277(-)